MKGLVILRRGEYIYSCDFVDKTLLDCSVDRPFNLNLSLILLTSEQSYELIFFGPCSLFPLEFLFSNLLQILPSNIGRKSKMTRGGNLHEGGIDHKQQAP